MPKFKEGDEVLVYSKHAMGEVKARDAFGNEWKGPVAPHGRVRQWEKHMKTSSPRLLAIPTGG